MFLMNLKNSSLIVALFFSITIFLFINNTAIASDWGCEGIRGNMNILKINSDPQGLLEGSDCDTDVKSGDGEQGKQVYVLQATGGAMSIAFNLDISDSVIDEEAVVKLMRLESGLGYDQALLLDVQLMHTIEGMQLVIDWYQPANHPGDNVLVQSDVFDVSDYAVNGIVTVGFDWNAGIATFSVAESGAVSLFADARLFSPRIYHMGVIEQSGINMHGRLYRFYDTEISLIN